MSRRPRARRGRGGASRRRLRRRHRLGSAIATGGRLDARRRKRSPASRISPLMNRNTLAATGLAKIVRNVCSSASPVMPTGIVARMISHASRSSASSAEAALAHDAGLRCAGSPRMMRTQSSAEEPQQRERRRAVQRDDVGEVERRLAGRLRGLGDERLPAAAEPGRDEHRVPEAGHREQLGDALDERDDDGLEVRHGGRASSGLPRCTAAGHAQRAASGIAGKGVGRWRVEAWFGHAGEPLDRA